MGTPLEMISQEYINAVHRFRLRNIIKRDNSMPILFELPIAKNNQLTRGKCGDCQECCMALKIITLDPPKPGWYICRHQGAKNKKSICKIYSKRPEECATYECAYLTGLFSGKIDGEDKSEEYRPDRLGVIIDLRELDGEEFIQVWETRRGLINNAKEGKDDENSIRINAVITYLVSKMPVMIRYFNGEKISFVAKNQELADDLAFRYLKACQIAEGNKEGR